MENNHVVKRLRVSACFQQGHKHGDGGDEEDGAGKVEVGLRDPTHPVGTRMSPTQLAVGCGAGVAPWWRSLTKE